MKIAIAYANLNDFQHGEDYSFLPSYIQLPTKPTFVQQHIYNRRRLAYFLLWQLGKTHPNFAELIVNIYKDEDGRPQIPSSYFDFNISHSGEWVAVILAENLLQKPCVAIDIEMPTKARNYLTLMQHFATPQEYQWFLQQNDRQQAFYQSWCLREACLKASGVGLRALSKCVIDHEQKKIVMPRIGCITDGYAYTLSHLPFYAVFYLGGESISSFSLSYFTR